jgi:hypothetical protein
VEPKPPEKATKEHPHEKSPHPIGPEDFRIADVANFKRDVKLDEPERVIDWTDLISNLESFNPAVANFAEETIKKARDDQERQLVADTIYTLYWAAKLALDPQSRHEYDREGDEHQAAENERVVQVEQVRV